jgi:hypothetical protein
VLAGVSHGEASTNCCGRPGKVDGHGARDYGAVAGTPSTYIVSAENGIHQGPFSNQATATAP